MVMCAKEGTMYLRKKNQYRRRVYKTGGIFNVGPTTTRYAILLLLAVFSLLYLIQSAQGADKTIELRNLADRKETLDQELTTLEVNASRWQSLQNLSQSSQSQGLVPIGGTPESITVSPAP